MTRQYGSAILRVLAAKQETTMAKPYDMYEAGEIVEVGFNGTDREIAKLAKTPVQHGSDWIVVGYIRKTATQWSSKPTTWWARTITPAPFR